MTAERMTKWKNEMSFTGSNELFTFQELLLWKQLESLIKDEDDGNDDNNNNEHIN